MILISPYARLYCKSVSLHKTEIERQIIKNVSRTFSLDNCLAQRRMTAWTCDHPLQVCSPSHLSGSRVLGVDQFLLD
jgi:hypothetical protein